MVAAESESSSKGVGPPRNLGVRKLIEGKRKWHYSPDPEAAKRGFRGWHERGYLPHFDAPHVTQFLTFMLWDSFPITRRREWEPILQEPDESMKRRKLEAWLDRGHGACWLRRPELARLVEKALRAADGENYRLRAWVIMPNHVHVVVDVWDKPLSRLLNDWKGGTARAANQVLGRTGHFWQREYFDIRIRDEEHLARAVRYTERNPVKGGLIGEAKRWPWSSAGHRDEYGRLVWQRPRPQ